MQNNGLTAKKVHWTVKNNYIQLPVLGRGVRFFAPFPHQFTLKAMRPRQSLIFALGSLSVGTLQAVAEDLPAPAVRPGDNADIVETEESAWDLLASL
jgi:hypothetical protein